MSTPANQSPRSLSQSDHADAFLSLLTEHMPEWQARRFHDLHAWRWTALLIANTYGGSCNLRIDRVGETLRIVRGKLRELRQMKPRMTREIAPFGPPLDSTLERIRAKDGEEAMRAAMHSNAGGILIW